jgi:hypothetical protein
VTSRREALVGERGRAEFHVGDDETPWVPLVPDVAWIKHLAFDVRAGTATHILKVGAGGILERHRHRGGVVGYTLSGSWRYLEYDWVATAGSWVQEFPGAIHTLRSDAGMETLFRLEGPLELLDDEDNVFDILDVFWYIDSYLGHCRREGLAVNERLFV